MNLCGDTCFQLLFLKFHSSCVHHMKLKTQHSGGRKRYFLMIVVTYITIVLGLVYTSSISPCMLSTHSLRYCKTRPNVSTHLSCRLPKTRRLSWLLSLLHPLHTAISCSSQSPTHQPAFPKAPWHSQPPQCP